MRPSFHIHLSLLSVPLSAHHSPRKSVRYNCTERYTFGWSIPSSISYYISRSWRERKNQHANLMPRHIIEAIERLQLGTYCWLFGVEFLLLFFSSFFCYHFHRYYLVCVFLLSFSHTASVHSQSKYRSSFSILFILLSWEQHTCTELADARPCASPSPLLFANVKQLNFFLICESCLLLLCSVSLFLSHLFYHVIYELIATKKEEASARGTYNCNQN